MRWIILLAIVATLAFFIGYMLCDDYEQWQNDDWR